MIYLTASTWFLLLQTVSCFSLSQRPRKVASELLLPLHSTTALMCDPVFHGEPSTAIWYRNGRKVATVTSNSNALYGDRNYTSEEKIPEVGFLIISNIEKADEGEFWCRKDDSIEASEVSYLRVAYVDLLPKRDHIRMEPPQPVLGEPLWLHCSLPNAAPNPTVTWSLDQDPVSASSDVTSYQNGSLFIPSFSSLHIGTFRCTVANFAGQTTTELGIDVTKVQLQRASVQNPVTSSKCSVLFRSSMFWFLIGCLVTSSGVLIYLLCALFLLHPNPSRATIRPEMWLRSHHLLGPGFRKTVAPTPDYLVPPNSQQEI